ncbi:ATP-dependent DNA helicase pfh1-like [Neltuma alba]|uniref:ATP-dependent DNA helicase pfh1-like n=1 Tax=Neltuma alba TaxID=207710 RepID=UPI0010A3A929|nr:ATP-dependent DNA helicase pfh1-like [Prosopis alba]
MFEAHINVEKSNQSSAIKYLFKYPVVERLSFHLPNQQCVVYSNADDIEDLLNKRRVWVHISISEKEEAALKEIESLLQENGKTLNDFPLLPKPASFSPLDLSNHLILQELGYDRTSMKEELNTLINSLNSEQKHIFDSIISSLNSNVGSFFFVYGYSGTGKTFLWNALASTLRARGDIVIIVSSSGIAATLLPFGRTVHSRFAIPIQVNEDSICNITQNSALANLIVPTKLIIWDEAPMVQRYCIEAFDRTLRDIMHANFPFGGKSIVMGGDFCQILPVIPKGSKADIVNACVTSSYLWDYCTIFTLTKNMRLSFVSSIEEQKDL